MRTHGSRPRRATRFLSSLSILVCAGFGPGTGSGPGAGVAPGDGSGGGFRHTAPPALVAPAPSAAAQAAGASEAAARRKRLLHDLADGILLVHARSGPKREDQPGYDQDPTFLHLTGLAVAPGAILALDGPAGAAHLFVAPAPLSFGRTVPGLSPQAGERSARALGLTSVRPWERFVPWLRGRLREGVRRLYVDAPRRPEMAGAPPGMRPVAGPLGLWRAALRESFPEAELVSAVDALRALRWVKSPAEVALLRANARRTVRALAAAAAAIAPGVRQRRVEAAVVAACLADGGQGPSFWPWAMSGPNAHVGRLVRAFYDRDHLDRTMQAGELVRVDIGCRGGGYGADVGRTLPVSGRFSPRQREAWDLLVAGYRAGLRAMRDGVVVSAVRAASRRRVRELLPTLRDEEVRDAAARLDADSAWHLHGVGVESGEEALPVLHAGSVLAYEPMFVVGDDALYLEDMILVTATGHEVLNTGLPATAAEIEAWMAAGASSSAHER